MDVLQLLSEVTHYLLPAVGAWLGARGRLDRLERDLRDHKEAPVPPAHQLANGKGSHA